eukprot:TRINITY_DN32368_c0_g1_i1.p1 TRINITY_DN32368_c0_g1~~TRINITY_DN32368_c0_g1_i1.p1  ORF type:complete len:309 (+),score=75.09 TRINITY_DN32368_c0_g1_i1:40-966(+)
MREQRRFMHGDRGGPPPPWLGGWDRLPRPELLAVVDQLWRQSTRFRRDWHGIVALTALGSSDHPESCNPREHSSRFIAFALYELCGEWRPHIGRPKDSEHVPQPGMPPRTHLPTRMPAQQLLDMVERSRAVSPGFAAEWNRFASEAGMDAADPRQCPPAFLDQALARAAMLRGRQPPTPPRKRPRVAAEQPTGPDRRDAEPSGGQGGAPTPVGVLDAEAIPEVKVTVRRKPGEKSVGILLDPGDRLVLEHVRSGTPAEASGLNCVIGMRIVSANGQPVSSKLQLKGILQQDGDIELGLVPHTPQPEDS